MGISLLQERSVRPLRATSVLAVQEVDFSVFRQALALLTRILWDGSESPFQPEQVKYGIALY